MQRIMSTSEEGPDPYNIDLLEGMSKMFGDSTEEMKAWVS
jgi:hypothetical protein